MHPTDQGQPVRTFSPHASPNPQEWVGCQGMIGLLSKEGQGSRSFFIVNLLAADLQAYEGFLTKQE